jgi:predicted metal-dependent phosphoesterase TrpH
MDDAGDGVQSLTPTADLHLHSTASDGALSPSEVVRQAHRAGLAAIALTDHDSMAGLPEARAEASDLGVDVLTGCEFSVAAEWGELHLLGYQLSEVDPTINTFLIRMRRSREERGREIVERIGRCGISLDFERVKAIAGNAPIGRPHVAKALMAAGVTRNFDEAFDRLLGRGRPAFVGKDLAPVAEVTAMIRAAGGVSVVAHPKDRATRPALETLRAQGVDGVEVRHPSHSAPVQRELERLARELGLLPTGGSDSHGEKSVSSAHREVGGVRIPMEWVDGVKAMAAGRRDDRGSA